MNNIVSQAFAGIAAIFITAVSLSAIVTVPAAQAMPFIPALA
ncbi:MAG: hypothetical protein AAFR70_04955 [Pseudomonadota bacterium]